MESKIRVVLLKDNTYQVMLYERDDAEVWDGEVLHQGSLADCEAYIRLRKRGMM